MDEINFTQIHTHHPQTNYPANKSSQQNKNEMCIAIVEMISHFNTFDPAQVNIAIYIKIFEKEKKILIIDFYHHYLEDHHVM